MTALAEMFTRLRILLSYGPGLGLLVILHEAIRLQRPDLVDKAHRVRSVEWAQILEVYDFVVVGGGSAGAVMASRLSEIRSWNVLLLEAGPDESLLSEVPFLFPVLQHSTLDWEFETIASDRYCLGAEDGRCQWPRGKVLGGSSVLNAMMYVRGNRKDYDRWASLGNPGWNYEAVLPYFRKSQETRVPHLGNDEFHSTGGYLTVEFFRATSALKDLFMAAGAEMGLLNPGNDVNGHTQFGFSQTQGTIRNGLRCSTNKAFLRPVAHRRNLHISLNTFVEKLLIDPRTKRAYGVRFSRDGQIRDVFASKEVILSAGAVQTPQILMLSCIGPTIELIPHGIHPIHDLPGVGQNLQDHIAAGGGTYIIENPYSNQLISMVTPNFLNFDTIRDFTFNSKGPLYLMALAEVMAYINTKYQKPDEDWPDVQVFFSCVSDTSDGGAFSRRGGGMSYEYYSEVYEPYIYQDAMMIIPLVMRPRSRGRITLNSADPHEHPAIFANYFADPYDLEVLVS